MPAGAAVRGPRVQADCRFYAGAIQNAAGLAGLEIKRSSNALRRPQTHADGGRLSPGLCPPLAPSLAASFISVSSCAGGRVGEKAATAMAGQLRAPAFRTARLKTARRRGSTGGPHRLVGAGAPALLTRKAGTAAMSNCRSSCFAQLSLPAPSPGPTPAPMTSFATISIDPRFPAPSRA